MIYLPNISNAISYISLNIKNLTLGSAIASIDIWSVDPPLVLPDSVCFYVSYLAGTLTTVTAGFGGGYWCRRF